MVWLPLAAAFLLLAATTPGMVAAYVTGNWLPLLFVGVLVVGGGLAVAVLHAAGVP